MPTDRRYYARYHFECQWCRHIATTIRDSDNYRWRICAPCLIGEPDAD